MDNGGLDRGWAGCPLWRRAGSPLAPLPTRCYPLPVPTIPQRYPRIALPPSLAARVDALRLAAPTGRPSRQAVVERALAVGLDALEGRQGGRDGVEGCEPGQRAADAPNGLVGPAVGHRVPRTPENDREWPRSGGAVD